jgi:hypothetical protein
MTDSTGSDRLVSGGYPMVEVAPHRFRPLRLWDLRAKGRCRRCRLPMDCHPVHTYVPARALGDTRPAAWTWENLHG